MSETTDDLQGTEERPTYYHPTDPKQQLQITGGPLSSLNEDQRSRVGALHLVKDLLTAKNLFGDRPADVFDLMRLAEWVLTGVDLVDIRQADPTDVPQRSYPYESGDVMVLGPGVLADREHEVIQWLGVNYYARDEDLNGDSVD